MTTNQKKFLWVLCFLMLTTVLYRDSKIEQRMNTKHFLIDESAEPFRADIEKAHAYWEERAGVEFIEVYKPFRTVVIYCDQMKNSIDKDTVGAYWMHDKHICIFNKDNFYLIVLHEIGHSLGIPHNDDINDIMYPRTNNLGIISTTCLKQLEQEREKNDYLLFY